MKKQTDYIYGLYYIKDGEKVYYYAGITKDHERRSAEHSQNKDAYYKRGSKDGTAKAGEIKKGKYGEAAQLAEYVYYRQVVEGNYEDGFEVLETVVEGELAITEDAVMARLIADGHPLQNSKQGERWTRWTMLANRKVRTIQDVRKSDAKDAEEKKDETDRVLEMMKKNKSRYDDERDQIRLAENRKKREEAMKRKLEREAAAIKAGEKRNAATAFVKKLLPAFVSDTHETYYEYRDRWYSESGLISYAVMELVMMDRDEWQDFMFKRAYRVLKRREGLSLIGKERDREIIQTNINGQSYNSGSLRADQILSRICLNDGIGVYLGEEQ